MEKICSKCKISKELEEFYNFKDSKDGKTYQCKECMSGLRNSKKEESRLYMKNLRETDNERIKEVRRKSWRNLDPKKKMLQQSKNRANRKGITHNIDLEDIILPDVCPILGIPFVIGTKDNYENTYSLDRIDNTKGYIKNNIQVISKKANSMKNSGTPEELLKLADWIYKHWKK